MAARKNKVNLSDRWKDAISLSMLHKRLTDHIDGKIELTSTQVKSIELILQRGVPTLSAVEQTTISEDEKLDDNQILAKLSALIEQHPDIVQQALALRARQSTAPLPDTTIKPDIKAA
jgi:hypothetical protein